MRVDIDQGAISRLRDDRDVQWHFRRVGIHVMRNAKTIAPKRLGYYVESIGVRLQRRPLVVYVYAADFKAHWIEWGAGPSPYRDGKPFRPRHTLQRALEMSGLRLVKARKGTP